MIDTHAHVGEEVLENEVNWSNLNRIVLAGTDLKDLNNNLVLSEKDPRYLACGGIHPENIDVDLDKFKNIIKINRKRIFAIGECGLDALCPELTKQQEVFESQIKMAIDYDLPLVIHARKLNDEIIEILRKYPKHRGVFHCYTGGKKRISKILDLGEWYFGVDGNITYELGLEEVLREIPKERVLAETDCPYLTPLPHRGEKNYPQYVEFVYKKIAEIWGKNIDESEEIIDGNAKRLLAI